MIENKSRQSISVSSDPAIQRFERNGNTNTFTDFTTTKFLLPPDSSLQIITYFGPCNIGCKIKEEDLKYNYLKIVSGKDSIVANNRSELYKLLRTKRNIGYITIE